LRLVVGALIRLTGIGGVALKTPGLILGLGVPATTAVGTDLFCVSSTKVVGALRIGVKARSIGG